MPSELPLIKSPGMNRRDLKYLESAENKENNAVAVGLDFNGALEDVKQPQPPQQQQQQHQHQQQHDQNNPYIDESLGISPLPGVNETCFTEQFNQHQPLYASTPMTNQFKVYKYPKDISPQHQQHDPRQNMQHLQQQENLQQQQHMHQQQQQQQFHQQQQQYHQQQQYNHQHQQYLNQPPGGVPQP